MGAPIKYTCPDIDKVIGLIKEVEKICNNMSNRDSEELQDVWYYLCDIEDMLENLRNSNSALRGWGEEMEETAGKAEAANSILLDKMRNLKGEIIELRDEISSLQGK